MTDLLLGALRLEMRPISTYLLLLLFYSNHALTPKVNLYYFDILSAVHQCTVTTIRLFCK